MPEDSRKEGIIEKSLTTVETGEISRSYLDQQTVPEDMTLINRLWLKPGKNSLQDGIPEAAEGALCLRIEKRNLSSQQAMTEVTRH